jgi:hypothetical protein
MDTSSTRGTGMSVASARNGLVRSEVLRRQQGYAIERADRIDVGSFAASKDRISPKRVCEKPA